MSMDIKTLIRNGVELTENRLNELLPGEDVAPTTLHKAMRSCAWRQPKPYAARLSRR